MDLQAQLFAGNTRSNRDFIAQWVGNNRTRLQQLMRSYLEGEKREAQLAAGVLFSYLEVQPEMIKPWLVRIVNRMGERDIHPAVRRVALRVMMEVEIPPQAQGRVLNLCFRYLADPSEPIAIRVFAMGTVARMAETKPELWNELLQTIQMVLPYSPPAYQAHARKVFKKARALSK